MCVDKLVSENIKPTTGEQLRLLFINKGEINPWTAYRLLKIKGRFRGSYGWVRKLFYVARRLGLIMFTHEEIGKTQIPKRFYRIITRYKHDSRWRNLHAELYPSSAIGGLNYAKEKSNKDHNGH